MNYKLLFPTYRTRQRFVVEMLDRVTSGHSVDRMLNLGTGEGDYDRSLKTFCRTLEACDINADDVAHAAAVNAEVEGINYSVQNGQSLSFADGYFDVVTCLEVIEHVDDPRQLLREIARVLRPGGHAVLTCPNVRFPSTYDPVNYALDAAGLGGRIRYGAYGYGHSWLVDEPVLKEWLDEVSLNVVLGRHLSKHLAGLLECYWPGVLQKLFKANSGNRGDRGRVVRLRPSFEEPALVRIADAIIDADTKLFANQQRSVGLGYLIKKS